MRDFLNITYWAGGLPFHLFGDRKRDWNSRLLVAAQTDQPIWKVRSAFDGNLPQEEQGPEAPR